MLLIWHKCECISRNPLKSSIHEITIHIDSHKNESNTKIQPKFAVSEGELHSNLLEEITEQSLAV